MKKLIPALLSLAVLAACQQQTEPSTPPAASEVPAASAASAVPASEAASTPAASAAAGGSTKKLTATDVRKDDIGGDFTLTDGQGKPFALSSLKGKVVLLSFGFTHCPDVCPTELLTFSDALKQLGADAKDVAVVFVSVDYERDTPELIGKYVSQFNPDFIGLTDDKDGKRIPLIKQQYRIVSAKTEIKSDTVYNMDHTAGAYILDKDGETALFAPYGMEAPELAQAIRTLL